MPPFDRSLIPTEPDLSFESPLWEAGLTAVAGIDEAGRGALAGPVYAGAVILPPDPLIASYLIGVRDSKQLTAGQRENARDKILQYASAWAVGWASNGEIDQVGILPATRLAAWRALTALSISPQHILLDYLFLPDVAVPQTALIKGDCRSLSIAAASILAKTSRDEVLRELDLNYPGYGFAAHKGYGTTEHRSALQHLGACPIHRTSFTLFREDETTFDKDQLETGIVSQGTLDQ